MNREKNIRDPDCHRYALEDGWEVLAGKTDRDNELLSLHTAHPNDWWFHVNGVPGSHVILRHPESIDAPVALLKTAAAIAAWHSKARAAGTVSVHCARAAQVHKARGAQTGTVQVRKGKILKVRPALPQG
jgi:predicted ribosome quality control (RQC) complex YloA/Tae2 family protein